MGTSKRTTEEDPKEIMGINKVTMVGDLKKEIMGISKGTMVEDLKRKMLEMSKETMVGGLNKRIEATSKGMEIRINKIWKREIHFKAKRISPAIAGSKTPISKCGWGKEVRWELGCLKLHFIIL
ncbi:hypothetical protein BN2127_JRS1_02760 [Bacillus cereus]|nr:hypothetical protein BN2127_JRS1_02760 [Bacillus cereus]